MKLIRQCKPTTLKEWEDFYIESGKEAKALKTKLTYTSLQELKQKCYNIDCKHGKTYDDLITVAKDYRAYLESQGIKLDMETCFNYTYIQAVDTTFIGYKRELTAFKALDSFCKENNLRVIDPKESVDLFFGVDYEIKDKKNNTICGIQVKGSNYKQALDVGSRVITESNTYLKSRNQKYTELNNVPVLNLYVNPDYTIYNPEVFTSISDLTKSKESLEKSSER